MVNWKTASWGFCALVGAAGATTAPGFPLQGTPDLNMTWAGNSVAPAGELLTPSETASPPDRISTPVWSTFGRAILIMVDSDVPRNGTRVQRLHWLTSNVTMPSIDTQTLKVPSADAAEAPYQPPAPPLNDTAHKYTILLFQQPDNFTIPARFKDALENRLPWDTADFVNASGLRRAPLAANWIRVQNTGEEETPTSTSSAPGATGNASAPTASPTSYPGAAAAVEARVWAAGLGTALVAGLGAFLL